MEMPVAEKKILEEVEYLKDRYFTFDDPVPFCGLFLRPVSVRYYNEFLACSACFTLNRKDEMIGMTMTNLGYLIYKMNDEKEGQKWSVKFSRLMELIFGIQNGMKCPKCGNTISFDEFLNRLDNVQTEEQYHEALKCQSDGCDGVISPVITWKQDAEKRKSVLIVDGHEINDDAFNKLRKYAMYQNLPDFKDDSWVEKSIRDDQALKQELASKDSGHASLEKKFVAVCAKTNYTIDKIRELSIRKFIMLLDTMQDAMEYQITRTGLMSGMVSLKKGQEIEHWIYKKDHGLYGKALDAEQFANQIKGA